MNAQDFVVTCLNCKGNSRLKIMNDKDVLYEDHVPIIASRLRPDLEWGFECLCGNDSRLAEQERDQLDVLVSGASKQTLEKLAANLARKNEKRFSMVVA